MGAVLRDSALYDKLHVKKYLSDARDVKQHGVFVPFELIGLSAANTGDTYNLCVLKANVSVRGLFAITDGLGTSVTIALGDSGSAARYLAATSFATSGLAVTGLAVGAYDYRPAADTVVVAVGAGAAVTVGKFLKGHFVVMPQAG